MKSILRLLGVGLCVMPLVAATAQTPKAAPAAKETGKETAKETVSVSAKKTSVQVLPDRTVYSLDDNIQSSTGSLSDVLRNLPSVDVDIEGNLSMRGDSNVSVLVDGKKSPLLSGNLADALQQIPANTVERIEVITNPPAEFRAEGSAGVINIVMRKQVKLVSSGSVRVNVGSEGRFNASASGGINLGKVMLNAMYSESKNVNKFNLSFERSDGTAGSSSQDFAMKMKMAMSMRMATLSAFYPVNEANSFTLFGFYNRFGMHFDSASLAAETISDSLSLSQRNSIQTNLGYIHNFAAKGEQFSLNLSRSTSWGRSSFDSTRFNAVDAADYWQSQHSTTRENNTELKADYTLPFGERDTFKAGYMLQSEDSLGDDHGLLRDGATADWTTDSANTNFFCTRSYHSRRLCELRAEIRQIRRDKRASRRTRYRQRRS